MVITLKYLIVHKTQYILALFKKIYQRLLQPLVYYVKWLCFKIKFYYFILLMFSIANFVLHLSLHQILEYVENERLISDSSIL